MINFKVALTTRIVKLKMITRFKHSKNYRKIMIKVPVNFLSKKLIFSPSKTHNSKIMDFLRIFWEPKMAKELMEKSNQWTFSQVARMTEFNKLCTLKL